MIFDIHKYYIMKQLKNKENYGIIIKDFLSSEFQLRVKGRSCKEDIMIMQHNKERINQLWDELALQTMSFKPSQLRSETYKMFGLWRYMYEQIVSMYEKRNYSYTGKIFTVEVSNNTTVKTYHHIAEQLKVFQVGIEQKEMFEQGIRGFTEAYNLRMNIQSIRVNAEVGIIYTISLHD